MSIPRNITKEHIEKAILEIKQSVIPAERLSVTYFLKVGNENLPPKYVISIANKYANGIELESKDFNAIEAKNFLMKYKYVIIQKNSVESDGYFQQLSKFLEQTKTTSLTTSQYEKKYSDLKVKVSFGQGNQAEIPWIAFLKENETVPNGIYPVYLFYKQKNILILAQGISETKKPHNNWEISSEKTIDQYFKENELGKPKRYGSSYVYKFYDLNLPLIEDEINHDLESLIKIYKSTFGNQTPIISKRFSTKDLNEVLSNAGLVINDKLTLRFAASLLTKPFVILTGLSGSGKTKLAQVFAKWICQNKSQYKMIPVGADWTNREPLLGYPNALEHGKYVLPESGVLELILNASKEENVDKPFFLILDEMNLSHVERYFADFLSAMESEEEISLHPNSHEWEKCNIIDKIKLPKNLFIVGTVNIDETTYMFSPKVLDRANVLEFRVSDIEMVEYLENVKPLDLKSIEGLGANMAASFIQMATTKDLKHANKEILSQTLIDFFKELKKIGAEFGYRSASEIFRFVAVANLLDPTWIWKDIIDCAIMQKLLPKVHGSRRKLEPILKTLGTMCLAEGKNIEEIFNRKSEINFKDPTIVKYPISIEKIDRMYKGLIDNGFTSYAEA